MDHGTADFGSEKVCILSGFFTLSLHKFHHERHTVPTRHADEFTCQL